MAHLKYRDLRLLDLAAGHVMHEEIVLKDFGRVRAAACGPDGAVDVVMNEPDAIWRVSMQSERINP